MAKKKAKRGSKVKNRSKSSRYRAAKKKRVKRKLAKSPHGKKLKKH
jgi:hypothetical protein